MTRQEEYEDLHEEGASKTQVKKEMLALQDLGLAMIGLPPAQYEKLELDERLASALEDLRRFKAHGARKRQMQFVGKLLRGYDVEPFRKIIASVHEAKARDVRRLHEIEQWRERLLANDEGWNIWTRAHPAGDTPQLRALLTEAQRELVSPAGRGRAYRELFRALLEILRA